MARETIIFALQENTDAAKSFLLVGRFTLHLLKEPNSLLN
jgi:hypothetical protein